jgi:uncharacterized protein (DUF1501 family)
MAANGKAPVFVVVQLTGGNDFMNTVIPCNNDLYYDFRPTISVAQNEVLPIDNGLGFNPNAAPVKELYDRGKVAIVQGVGYANSTRSHFRGMDIWHTCEPDIVAQEGWLGKVVRELDPDKENPLTAVSFGRGLPRALTAKNVTITSVGDLDTYGLMTGITDQQQRNDALNIFQKMYTQAIGSGPVREYLAQTGRDVLRGADVLKKAPALYSSDIEYADNPIAKSLRDVARVHLANLGTRVFYVQHGGYDTHANEGPVHPRLLSELSPAISDFFDDLRAHDAAENVVMLVFTEFGRRIRDNGSGTDHGAGGGSFIIGERVKGGLYAEYPSLDPDKHDTGDMAFNYDFRGLYSTILEQWLNIEPEPIVGGRYEQIHPFKQEAVS